MNDRTRLALDDIHALAFDALRANAFSDAQAGAIANTLTAAERDHCLSHGLFRVPFYVAALANPDASPDAEPRVRADETAIVHVDAAHGFCPLALERGCPVLAERAAQHGIAALAIHEVYNVAALWPEVEWLAEQGLVAFAFTAAMSYVAPAGGTEPLYGTNPMAFAWPRPGRSPLVFDQASSASARGEILLHQREGRLIPDGWAIDRQGRPTNDPAAALDGAQLCFGGHKGAALALMVELLAGALIGDLFSHEASAHDVHDTHAPLGGEFLIAIDPGHFARGGSPTAAFERAEQLFERILAQEGTRLPSDRRFTAREDSLANGVWVPDTMIAQLRSLASGQHADT